MEFQIVNIYFTLSLFSIFIRRESYIVRRKTLRPATDYTEECVSRNVRREMWKIETRDSYGSPHT